MRWKRQSTYITRQRKAPQPLILGSKMPSSLWAVMRSGVAKSSAGAQYQGFKTWAKFLREQAPEMAAAWITKEQMEVDYVPILTREQTTKAMWWTEGLKLQGMFNRPLTNLITTRTQGISFWFKCQEKEVENEKRHYVHLTKFILQKAVSKSLRRGNVYNRMIPTEEMKHKCSSNKWQI